MNGEYPKTPKMYIARIVTQHGFEVSFNVYGEESCNDAAIRAVKDWQFYMSEQIIALTIEEA